MTWNEVARRLLVYMDVFASSKQGLDPAARPVIAGFTRLAWELDQVMLLEGDSFIAWLRCSPANLTPFLEVDVAAARRLGREELTGGSVLYVAEWLVSGHGPAYRLLDGLAQQTGCKWIAGWRRGQFRIRYADTWRERVS